MKMSSEMLKRGVFILTVFLLPQVAHASLDLSRLVSTASTFEGDVETITKAIAFSIFQPESRTKIPGPGTFFLETGYHVTDVNEKRLYLYTDNQSSPSTFDSIFATAGVGLPFGLAGSIGFSQVVSEHTFNGLYASMTAQVFDFTNLVYTDLVPTLTIDGTLARTLSQPSCSVYTAQGNLGAFQRTTGTQFAYTFQFAYAVLGAVAHANGHVLVRHGIMTSVPLWAGVNLRTQVQFPDLTATVGVGYEF